MKRLLPILLLAAFAAAQTPSPNQPNRQAAFFVATSYNYLIDATFQQGLGASFTFLKDACLMHLANNRTIVPFNTNASVFINDGANSETVAFQSLSTQTGYCVLRLNSTKTHLSYQLRSGTFGLQEAINDATAVGGGVVVVDSAWAAAGGTTAMITGAAGSTAVGIQDLRSGIPATYAWNGSVYALLTFGGSPGGIPTQVQVNVGGLFGGIASAGAGAVTLSNGTSQTKSIIDARDIGVDCTYTNDSAAVLNAITDNESAFGGQLTGATLRFPPNCHVKLATNWRIVNQGSFTIEGASRGATPGAGSSTTISYCGSSATVPVIDMESTFGGEVANLAIETKGSGCSTGTNVGITVDKANATSIVNSTDNFLHDLTIIPNLQGGTGPTGWVGVAISPIAISNVEDTRLWNSRISCNSTPSSVGVQVSLGGSFNAKLEEIKHTQVNACPLGLQQDNGNWSVEGMDAGGNTVDITLGPGSDPSLVTNLISESAQAITSSGTNWPDTLIANHVGWNGASSNNLCGFDFTGNNGDFILIGNGADVLPGAAPNALPMCAGTTGNITDIGNEWGAFGPNGPGGGLCIVCNFNANKGIGSNYGHFNGGTLRLTNAAPSPQNTLQSVGYGFISHNGMDMLGMGFNANSNQECVGGGRPCVGADTIFLGNEGVIVQGMWPIPQYLTFCSYTGAAGSTHWNVTVLPIDAQGKRAGAYPFGGNSGCNNAASTLTSNNFLTVSWPRVTGATNYAILLMCPCNPVGAAELFTTVADSGSGVLQSINVTSGATTDTFNYSFPLFYESSVTTIRGESALFYGGTTYITEPNVATNVANFSSSLFDVRGNVWNGSVGINDDWIWQNVVGAGTNPTTTLTLTHTGSSGTASVSLPALTNSVGGFQQNGNALGQFCGTTSTCSATAQPLTRVVFGSAPLVSGTPSAVTITGFSPAFTSTTSFVCTVTNATTAADSLKVVNASASSITITGPNTVTDTVNYTCMGT